MVGWGLGSLTSSVLSDLLYLSTSHGTELARTVQVLHMCCRDVPHLLFMLQSWYTPATSALHKGLIWRIPGNTHADADSTGQCDSNTGIYYHGSGIFEKGR